MILAVTGGRHEAPLEQDLPALWAACMRREIQVVRVGCCPTGVDEAVWRAALAFDRRRWALERWVADWSHPRNSGGPLRNRAMAQGDQRLVARVLGPAGVKPRSQVSIGPISALVHWPGNRGTASMVEEAQRVGARIVPIAELRADR